MTNAITNIAAPTLAPTTTPTEFLRFAGGSERGRAAGVEADGGEGEGMVSLFVLSLGDSTMPVRGDGGGAFTISPGPSGVEFVDTDTN